MKSNFVWFWNGRTAITTSPFIIITFLITGQSHGGLHFPRGTFSFQGRVAEINVKLQDEIAEWQKRMQEYLLEVHNLQQQQQQQTAAAAAGSGSGSGPDLNPQPQVVAQNGAPQANNEDHLQNQHEEAGGEAAEQPRSSSQLRE